MQVRKVIAGPVHCRYCWILFLLLAGLPALNSEAAQISAAMGQAHAVDRWAQQFPLPEPKLPLTACGDVTDSCLPRHAALRSLIQARNGGGSSSHAKSSAANRFFAQSRDLTDSARLTSLRSLSAAAHICWPLGQSAAESVVLLRRLLL